NDYRVVGQESWNDATARTERNGRTRNRDPGRPLRRRPKEDEAERRLRRRTTGIRRVRESQTRRQTDGGSLQEIERGTREVCTRGARTRGGCSQPRRSGDGRHLRRGRTR